jgi:putative nucleotidyltransferase with HDIG domain
MSSPLEINKPGSQQRVREFMQASAVWFFAATVTVGMSLVLTFDLVSQPHVQVTIGQAAVEEVIAPASKTYPSIVLTNEKRQQAADAVPDAYTPLDLTIGRRQSTEARDVLNFIEVVRADPLAEPDVKESYLLAIDSIEIQPETIRDLLSLSNAEYEAVESDVLRIIEEVMRQEIREDGLIELRRELRRYASFELTPLQERLVTTLTAQFIVANSFYDGEATEQARIEAAAAVETEEVSVTQGMRILRAGDIVDEADMEMLAQFGLVEQETSWRDVASAIMVSSLAVTLLSLYWQRFFSQLYDANRYLFILGILLLLFLLIAKLLITLPQLAYLFPAAALAMLLAVLLDARLAIVVTAIMGLVIGFIAQNSLELAVYTVVGGTMAVLTLHDPQRISALFRAGLLASIGQVATILLFRLPQDFLVTEIFQLLLVALANGVLSASLALAGFFLIGGLFGIMTTVQLQDLSRLDHQLLQELLRRAPGTYHHSIMVANLAEQAAERIRANSALVRVGAFYHDVGKMTRPPFFTENHEGVSPHDALDPHSSARIIMAHVTDGLEMARRYRLPSRIRDFIAEHHGNRVVKSFYLKAVEAAGGDPTQVDISRFRYKGPRPRSRETAIVQLADAIEATSAALRPNTEAEIEKLVTSLIDDHLRENQLDNSGLTLGDIQKLKESFINTLKGRFHVRVRYPGDQLLEITADNSQPRPALPAPSVAAPPIIRTLPQKIGQG